MEENRVQVVPNNAHLRYVPEFRGEEANWIFEFFMVYSRFEYALKQAGFRRIERDEHVAPDWRAFCTAVQAKFYPNKSPELCQAYNYYLSQPPKIQILVDDQLSWKPNRKRENETEFTWVIRSIGIVRNNLFHGGKFPWDAVRDTRLIYHGAIILNAVLKLDKQLYEKFIFSP